MRYSIVQVKEECKGEDLKDLIGINIFAVIDDAKRAILIRPLEVEDMEKYYKSSFDNGMNETISDDYEYFIYYMCSEDCEFVSCLKENQYKIIREATKEDDEILTKNFEEFKRIHKFKEREDKLKKEEEEEKKALEEFLKHPKEKIKIKVKDIEVKTEKIIEKEIEAVVYKGFAIHNPLESFGDNPLYKDITILSGNISGYKMTKLIITKCYKFIDKVREYLGERDVDPVNDKDGIRKILNEIKEE